jgi:phosphomethylpyrimidine synthase
MTQIEAARREKRTTALKEVAKAETVATDDLIALVASGKVVIPFNHNHSPSRPTGIGRSLRTKVNVNIRTSADFPRLADELRKVDVALKYDTDAIMDLSTGGTLKKIRRRILSRFLDSDGKADDFCF